MAFEDKSFLLAIGIFVVLPVCIIIFNTLPDIIKARSEKSNKKHSEKIIIEDEEVTLAKEKAHQSNILVLVITLVTVAISCVLAYLV